MPCGRREPWKYQASRPTICREFSNAPRDRNPIHIRFSSSYSKEPLFVVKPRSSEAYEGDNIIIFCEVVGDPKPEVVWLRDFLNVSM